MSENEGTVTRLHSVTVTVTDQDAAKAFFCDVLGCELREDVELWPGARWLEVAPPGSPVGIALLHPDSGLPLAPRLGTADAAAAHRRLRAGGADVDELLRLDFAPPMFTFRDPQQNLLVVVEDEPGAGA